MGMFLAEIAVLQCSLFSLNEPFINEIEKSFEEKRALRVNKSYFIGGAGGDAECVVTGARSLVFTVQISSNSNRYVFN